MKVWSVFGHCALPEVLLLNKTKQKFYFEMFYSVLVVVMTEEFRVRG